MLSTTNRHLLKSIARQAIVQGLETDRIEDIDLQALPKELTALGASFVTLHKEGLLRGCIGSLEAFRPLAIDVAHNAYAAAFNDPRFSPLLPNELDKIDLEISVLSEPTPITCSTEQELLEQLRPNIDGLIIEDNFHRATFLPTVWESLPDTADFVHHLKLKAGLPAQYWSDEMACFRYTTESF